MRSHRGCVGLRGHARRFREMLLRIGHKRRGGFPELTAVCSAKTVQILIDAAGPCGGG